MRTHSSISERCFGPVLSLIKHRELLLQFARRYVAQQHRGSLLGIIWVIFSPLLMMTLYTTVFYYVFKGNYGVKANETTLDYAIVVYLSLTVYNLFSEVLGTTNTLILSQPNFVKKVVFPLEVLPAAQVFASVFRMLISLALVLLLTIILDDGLPISCLWLPVILAPILLLVLGIGWFVSALGVFFRDLAQLIQLLSTALMWMSAVFFPVQKIPASLYSVLRFNPLLQAVELSREAAIWGISPWSNAWALGYLWISSLVCFFLGYLFFNRVRPAFADVI